MSDKSCGSTHTFIKEETHAECCNSNNGAAQPKSDCCGTDAASNSAAEPESNCCRTGNASIDRCDSSIIDGKDEVSKLSEGNENAEYRIHGMDCPSCAVTIEKGLNRLSEISEAQVNYNTGKLRISGSPVLSFDTVENTVHKLGFKMESLSADSAARTYDVAGMDCGGCAQSIEKHLNTVTGVNHVSVSFSTGKMTVDHDNDVDEIIKEVSKLGYKASPVSVQNKGAGSASNMKEYLTIGFPGLLIASSFAGSFLGLPELASVIMYLVAMGISGYKPVKSAYYAVKSGALDMNVLMSAAAIGAALIGEWFEGALVVWLFSLGNILQNRSIEQTRKSIKNLMDLAPSEAWIKVGLELVKKPVEEIAVGQTIVVKPGDRIPLDGLVTYGETSVNQAPITGESMPVDKTWGDEVYAGTINESDSFEMEVTKLVDDTTISNIIHLVEEAQAQKAATQSFIDKFASIYTPIVFILALAVIVLPPVFGFGAWGEWVYRGLALLVIACPCALVISTPVAIVSAIGNAAKNGVLIKGGTFLEKAGTVDAIAFDKTGTLTEGKPKVSDILPFKISEDELISIARTLEDYSTHPIAKTVVKYAKEQGTESKEGMSFKNIAGKGVAAIIEGETYYAGNIKLFENLDASIEDVKYQINEIQAQGKTIVIIGTEYEISGIISVADTIRPTAVEVLSRLKADGVGQLAMLTGDNEGTAKMISDQTSVSRYFAELMPEDKVDAIKQLQSEGYKVAMVGDGINDAPALAMSDLGIAMGGVGTDTAMETADIILMADNLEKLPYTINLSQKALTIIKQNIWFSISIKVIALLLIVPGWLTLWMAVLSDTGAAIIVILNSLRLLKNK